ncbi:Mitochondrial escape protein 2 [Hypsizygus marmoreus]|uniref:Mitochondrial escape protein 2 n=1 Tax=Hypsizygus marmoreus TaxID=39966 RepID=A0A369JHL0_HYPMA|nr:Mitochondrial escape protein 2 [Hypsizygus marmoreus]
MRLTEYPQRPMISRALTTGFKPSSTSNLIRCCRVPRFQSVRPYSESPAQSTEHQEAWLFVDSVFPIQIARWDLRHYIGIFRQESLLTALKSRLESVKAHNFTVLTLESHLKDGGVFVRFSYDASDPNKALKTIEAQLKEEAAKHGGLPSWLGGINGGSIWVVKGTPWREDMNRFASPIIQITFEGPDVHEQSIYQLFRPYGRIQDLTLPAPVPAGTLRFSTVIYKRIHSATIARNVLHGFNVPSSVGGGPHISNETKTRLRTAYQRPVQAHAIRDWMSGHPKIMLPLLVFLLGTLTYTIFDPLRALMVQRKMLDWFDYREFKLYKWLRINTLDRLSMTFHISSTPDMPPAEEVWRERDEAVSALKSYLTELPTTVALIHGPQGSGKTRMLESVLKESGRKALVIDCRPLQKTTSDSQMVAGLATQTGYWPVFTFLNSLNSLIDLASVGLIGQKAGLSSSLTDQLQQILNVVGTGLKGVSSSHRATIKREIMRREQERIQKELDTQRRNRIRRGTWHDGRLDCVAGNGIMSELGIGDELLTENDGIGPVQVEDRKENEEELARRQRMKEDLQAVGALPIVVIRNYATRVSSSREELLTVLAQWAATLAENQIAHVIVISDNRENTKLLAKALPSRPPVSIACSDADSRSSVSFVKQKLRDADMQVDFTPEQAAYVERLGGRAIDLESLIHKVRTGQGVEEAVEDIINRGVGELRKNAFGDDIDDAKSLPWSREQAWAVLKLLAKHGEVPYHDVLLEFPFKGDETALRSMEHAELISIGTHDGRASIIRPGKPVYRWVFERLVNDPVFRATQDIAFNEKVITTSEQKITACEDELTKLKNIVPMEVRPWWTFGIRQRSATSLRVRYLTEKMLVYEKKIERLEKQNLELKKILVKGG